MEAQDTPQTRRAKNLKQRPGRCSPGCQSRPCQTASYSPLPLGLAPRDGTRRHDPHWAAPPAKSGHCTRRDRPQNTTAREL